MGAQRIYSLAEIRAVDRLAWKEDYLVDQGSPFTPGAATISSDGSVTTSSTSPLTGYTIITAESLADATEKAKGCPVLATGGCVEVYETLPVG